MNLIKCKQAIDVLFKSKITPLLVGHRGIGKTEIIRQYAEENGYSLIELRLGQMADAGDLIGLADFIKQDGQNVATNFMMPNFLKKVMDGNNGKYIIFLDEINRTTKDIIQAVFELVYDRRMSSNGFEMPTDCHIVAAQNPPTEEYETLHFNDSAYNDRFCFIKVDATKKEWFDYAKSKNIDSGILGFFQDQPDMLEPQLSKFNLDDLNVKPSRRSVFALNRVKGNCDNDSLFLELAMGLVGMNAATALNTYLQTTERNIDGDCIMNRYSSVRELIKTYSTGDTVRNDLLDSVITNLKTTLDEYETNKTKLNEAQETNLVDFLTDLPKDLSFNFLKNELLPYNFLCKSESDPDFGLGGNPHDLEKSTENAKRLIEHYKSLATLAKSDDSDEKVESEVTTDDIPF